jgi:two-component system CheB/CheR fusion protein
MPVREPQPTGAALPRPTPSVMSAASPDGGLVRSVRAPGKCGPNAERRFEAVRASEDREILNLEPAKQGHGLIARRAHSLADRIPPADGEKPASKEELQYLNNELRALNSRLQEALDQQRTSADDLKNVLYSTDLATLFLDRDLRIRFFTPATALLFDILPGDVGRRLSEVRSLGFESTASDDAKVVLDGLVPIEAEIEAGGGAWFVRRILPYRARDGGVEGVVVTYADITERKHAARALEVAKRAAEQANLVKSRFLAVASHDLRQPLQTLKLLQGLLAKVVEGDRAKALVSSFAETLGAMAGMLNTLLDINQIESGVLRVERVAFPISELLGRLKAEFSHQAKAQGLDLRSVRSSLWVDSDPRLVEQMIRNLLANALKYTKCGTVLLGCRRQGDAIRIEIWDTGVGIAEGQLEAIFEEYHQVENPALQRSEGLGLGLSIVRRLGDLLQHPVRVLSRPGSGSVFSIEVARSETRLAQAPDSLARSSKAAEPNGKAGAILLVEDDPDIRELLRQLLVAEGHHVVAAANGLTALELLAHGSVRPDIVLADFNLPGGLNGLALAAKVRGALHSQVAVAILTGDISAVALRDIARDNCVHLSKPVNFPELNRLIQEFLSAGGSVGEAQCAAPATHQAGRVYVVDDDRRVREAICSVLDDAGLATEPFSCAEDFLEAYCPGGDACLLVDAYLPGIGGLELMRRLTATGHQLPVMMVTGRGDIAIAVEAMKAGAMEFIEKPIARPDLLAAVTRALGRARDATSTSACHAKAMTQIAALTGRQRQIMDLVLAGHPSKNIAADLGISQRTVENHRASIMKKTGVRSLPALARLADAAA